MSTIKRLVGLGAGIAAIAAAAPAGAQYYGYSRYGSNYGYNNYGYGMNTNAAASQCTAAVQSRLYNRTSLGSILGSLVGVPTARGQVLSITQVSPRSNGMIRVRGLASSGRYASNGYGPYGVGAYGALGYGYNSAADLSFRCDVGYNGAVYDVRINRR
jgi:hypothetical protein